MFAKFLSRCCPALLVAALALSPTIASADNPMVGKWQFTVFAGGSEITVWIFEVSDKDGDVSAKVLAGLNPAFEKADIKSVKADAHSLHITCDLNGNAFQIDAYQSKKDKDALLGSVEVRGQRDLIQLSRTKETKIDPKKARNQGPAAEAVIEAVQLQDNDERAKAFADVLKKHGDDPVAVKVATELLKLKAKGKTPAAELNKVAEGLLEQAGRFGPEVLRDNQFVVAKQLSQNKGTAKESLKYLEKFEAGLPKDAGVEDTLKVTKVRIAALQNADMVAEAEKLAAKVEKLEVELDEEFEKTAIPFTPKAFKGRKGKSDRVVVLELFTGAQCPPCVAADVAFDALAKTYKDKDVILLQYHLHIPGPDPLTNGDSELRSDFYEVQGTPTALINGKNAPPVGGFKQHAEETYGRLTEALNEALEKDTKVDITLNAKRSDNKITMSAKVDGLEKPGKDMKLHFVLIEEVVRYPGGNQQRLHHHVVRDLPGGAAGIALEKASATAKQTVNLDDLQASLDKYLAEEGPYAADYAPINRDHLKVVAFVQNHESKEILNAVQVDLK